MMLSNIRFLIPALLAVGCNIDDSSAKNACVLQADCLDGYICQGGECVGGDNGSPDASGGGPYFGSVEVMTSQSSGLAAANYDTLVAATTASGALGCAVAGDLQASPGAGSAVLYAMVHASSGDTRCPNETFAIINDPERCKRTFPTDLYPGCSFYKRWDASGQQAAYQLATGGFVSVQQVYVSSTENRCDTQMSIQFPGGVTISNTFSFSFNPLGPAEKFCKNG